MAQHIQSVQPIPAEVQQLAEIHSLGAPTASYSKRPFIARFALIRMLCNWLGVLEDLSKERKADRVAT